MPPFLILAVPEEAGVAVEAGAVDEVAVVVEGLTAGDELAGAVVTAAVVVLAGAVVVVDDEQPLMMKAQTKRTTNGIDNLLNIRLLSLYFREQIYFITF